MKEKNVIFLFFFALATLFWFLNALSQQYDTQLKIDVDFEYSDPTKKIMNETSREIFVDAKAKGFELLDHNLHFFKSDLHIDISKFNLSQTLENQFVLATFSLRDKIVKWIDNESINISVIPQDTLVFFIDNLIQKKVPIVLNSKLSFESSFLQDSSLILTPDSLQVFGPQNILDSLDEIQTVFFEKSKINNDITETLELQIPKNVKTSVSKINTHISVAQFSEKQLIVPIETVNIPDSLLVKLFPSTVDVVAVLPLSYFELVTEANFSVVFDFAAIHSHENKLNLHAKCSSDLVRYYKILPDSTEFILEKKYKK